jgi:hypothetical protein
VPSPLPRPLARRAACGRSEQRRVPLPQPLPTPPPRLATRRPPGRLAAPGPRPRHPHRCRRGLRWCRSRCPARAPRCRPPAAPPRPLAAPSCGLWRRLRCRRRGLRRCHRRCPARASRWLPARCAAAASPRRLAAVGGAAAAAARRAAASPVPGTAAMGRPRGARAGRPRHPACLGDRRWRRHRSRLRHKPPQHVPQQHEPQLHEPQQLLLQQHEPQQHEPHARGHRLPPAARRPAVLRRLASSRWRPPRARSEQRRPQRLGAAAPPLEVEPASRALRAAPHAAPGRCRPRFEAWPEAAPLRRSTA